MKKLLLILPVILFSITVHAQQTEDDVYVGKSKTYGNYRGPVITIAKPKSATNADRNIKPINGSSTLSGTVIKLGWCEEDCFTFWIKKDDGVTVVIGTKDFGFSVPKTIVGKRIIIEGIEPAKLIQQKTVVKKEYQKDIQFAATGIKVTN